MWLQALTPWWALALAQGLWWALALSPVLWRAKAPFLLWAIAQAHNASISCRYVHSRQQRTTYLQVPFPMSGKGAILVRPQPIKGLYCLVIKVGYCSQLTKAGRVLQDREILMGNESMSFAAKSIFFISGPVFCNILGCVYTTIM